jgi:teichuronic acid exporter
MSNLKEKTAKGLGWGFVDNFLGTGVSALISIILARLLSPSDFGMVGMIAIFISVASSIMDSGFSGALIRKQNAGDADFNTVFYTNMVLGVILYIVLFFTAPAISSFYGIPLLRDIVRLMAISVIIVSFTQVQRAIFIRKIDFKTQTIISLSASLLSGVAGIWMALKGCGVWSLVVQQLSRLAIVSILLWCFSSWKPSFRFSVSSFKEMFSFGSKLMVSSLISVVWNEVYSLIIGKFYNPSLVGQYNRSEKFKTMVTTNIGQVVQRVSYPVMSNILDEKERQVRVYRKVIKTTVLITFTLGFGLMACADSMILSLIGDKWFPAIEFLRILLLSGIFLPLLYSSVNVFNVNGKSNLTLLLEVIKTILAVIPVLLGIYFSINALLWSLVGVSVVSYFIHAFFVAKVMNYSLRHQIADVLPYLGLSVLMGVFVYFTGWILGDMIVYLKLCIQLLAGLLFTIFNYEIIFKSEEYGELKREFFRIIRLKN